MRPGPCNSPTNRRAIRSQVRIIKLVAFASTGTGTGTGTGKTTTLVDYSRAHPDARILYLCYNKSVEVAAKQKFPLNVTCKTAHGLAYGAVGTKYKHKLGNLRLTDIARAIDSQNWEMVRSVQDTLNNYLASADEKIGLVHCSAEKLKNERMRRAASNVVKATGRLWAKICDLNNTIFFLHLLVARAADRQVVDLAGAVTDHRGAAPVRQPVLAALPTGGPV